MLKLLLKDHLKNAHTSKEALQNHLNQFNFIQQKCLFFENENQYKNKKIVSFYN